MLLRGRVRFSRRENRIVSVVAALAACLAVLFGASAVGAEPSIEDKRRQAELILSQVQELDAEVGAAAERFNGANYKLDQLASRLRETRGDLRRSRQQLGVARGHAGRAESSPAIEVFFGSGHPDLRDELPSHLGLIRSTDRGRSWDPVSLLGKADFHVLRAQGKTVYGYDSRTERLLVSTDAGRGWTTLVPPEALIDLAIDPKNPRHLLAPGGAVLYESLDGGRTWKAIASGIAGHLAWPTSGRVFLADLAGSFLTAPRASGPWRARGALGSPAAALLAFDEQTLFAALHDGTIVRSGNGGATWKVRATP